MKRLSILQLSFALLVFLGFNSCRKESTDTKMDAGLNQRAERLSNKGTNLHKETNLTSASGSGFMGDIITDPAMEWWYDKEGTMPEPYIYDIYTGTSPESQVGPDINAAHYISILWNSYPPYFGYEGNNYKSCKFNINRKGVQPGIIRKQKGLKTTIHGV